jgi:hypothetical protein
MLDRGLDPESFVRSYERGFFISNVQCCYLADDATCATALANLANCQAELLPCEAASRVISRYFPGIAHRRINASNKHVRSEDICRSLREEIGVRSGEDYLLNHIAQIRYRESTWASLGPVLRHNSPTAA